MTSKQKLINQSEKKEILIKLINCGITAGLVFFGAFVSGNINLTSVFAAFSASMVAALTQFRDFWIKKEPIISTATPVFSFIH